MLAIFLVSCGGGSGGSTGSPTTPSLPTATPAPVPTPIPSSQATSAPLSTTAATSVNFGSVASGGTTAITSAGVTIPKVSVASTATVALSAVAPSGVPTPSSRSLSRRKRLLLGVTTTPLAYFSISFSNTVMVATTPTFTVTFPSSLPTSNYYVAVYDPTGTTGGGWQVLAGPVNASGSIVTFNSTAYTPPLTFSSGVTYEFAIVGSASAIPTPTPIVASPASLSFTAAGLEFGQVATLTEAGYVGTFSPHAGLCANIVALSTGTTPGVFSIAPVNAGTCTIYFTDSNGTAVGVPITVTVTQFVGQ